MALPFTHKILIQWAGSQIFRDAQTLVERGLVTDVSLTPPRVNGSVVWCNRPLKTELEMMPDGTVENHCPCRDSRERGIVCAHVIALCVELIRRDNHPERVAARQEEARRASHLARIAEGAYLRRVKPDTPGALSARLLLTLGPDWRSACRNGALPLLAALEIRNRIVPLERVDPSTLLSFSKAEETLLYVLEDIAGGPVQGPLSVTPQDFCNLLALHAHLPLFEAGNANPLTVHATRLSSILKLDLDPATGELILSLHTEQPVPNPAPPLYLLGHRAGWLLGRNDFWPLETLLPDPLRGLYGAPVRIPRSGIPHFLKTEMALLARHLPFATDITPELFAIEPAEPRFRLIARGSPASLSATLYALYDNLELIAGTPDVRGHFALPDPQDLLRYLVRNPDREDEALATLRRFGLAGDSGNSLAPIVGTREVLNFLGSSLPAIHRLGWKVELEGSVQPFMDDLPGITPVVRITPSQNTGWFEVGFSFEETGGFNLTPAEIQRAIQRGESYVEKGGRVILLDADAIQSLNGVFNDCATGEGALPGTFRMSEIYAAYVNSSLDLLDGVDVEADPAWRKTALQQNRPTAAEPVVLSDALDNTLRSYQKEGVQWLRHLETFGFGGILADEMGLGKTLQTLAWFSLDRVHPEARGKPALIICPTSLVENWAEECQRFVPQLNVICLSGADRHAKWEQLPNVHLAITSYALLRRDLENYLRQEFAIVVLDEAQHIKNLSTQNAIAAKQLKAIHRLVLTGTPIENSVADLWSIMDFLMHGYLGSYDHFRHNYELPLTSGSTEAQAAQKKLRRKLHPFLLRRLKSEVATDLPARIEKLALCTLTPDQKLVYCQLLENSRRRLVDMVAQQGFQRSRMEVLKTLLRLRQACCHLELLKLAGLQSDAPSAKLDLFFELLDEALDGGHRVLVFSQFVGMLTILRREIEKRGLTFCYLDGATVERMSIVREFNGNRSIPLFLISLKAGGTGLNLVGADTVIHFDPWWNPAVEDQATDRVHRIGQKRTVYSIKMITRGTVEEKVLEMQKRKKLIFNATLAQEGTPLSSFSWDDVLELLTSP
jgi:superfamily II DNA or RNA helicase